MRYFVMKIMTTMAEMKSCYSSLFTSRQLVGYNTITVSFITYSNVLFQ